MIEITGKVNKKIVSLNIICVVRSFEIKINAHNGIGSDSLIPNTFTSPE